MSADDAALIVNRLELSGDLDRRESEALLLDLRRLAQRYGLELKVVPAHDRAARS